MRGLGLWLEILGFEVREVPKHYDTFMIYYYLLFKRLGPLFLYMCSRADILLFVFLNFSIPDIKKIEYNYTLKNQQMLKCMAQFLSCKLFTVISMDIGFYVLEVA